MTPTKTKTTYHIVCPNFGTREHTTHVYTKPTKEKAIERAEGLDSHYRTLAKGDSRTMYSYWRSEIGWKVQQQTVTEWETVHD